jgi:glutamate-1-semialdehyde 2,1-aminomutase
VGNMGCVLPAEGFLESIRKICDKAGIVLIFDEVMTGFRLAKGGAQERFNVMPDLTTLGKIIGGGMPVGAYGGKKEIMNCVSPEGPVYQAGTLSGNPIAMSAGLTMLHHLNDHPEVYERLELVGNQLVTGLRGILDKLNLNYTINHIGSMYSLFFTDKPVTNFDSAKTSDTAKFGKYFHAMLDRGIYLAPSQYESLFLSTALSDANMKAILLANEESLSAI